MSQSTGESITCGASEGQEATIGSQNIKIMSWNINGMRTLDIPAKLQELNCTVLAVQETKLARKQLDQSQIMPSGYSSYFSFSTNRIGYSGVATFCKDDWVPLNAEEGLLLQDVDRSDGVGCYPQISADEEPHVKHANTDGRTVLTQHLVKMPDGTEKMLTIINVYCPRHRDDPEDPSSNTEFKRTFHEVLHRRAKQLVQEGSFVVLMGDINISHKAIDQCDTDEKSFFVNQFRQLLNELLDAEDPNAFVDTFRLLHPQQEAAYTCWCTRLNARENNYGTRIDYIFVDKQLAKYIEKAEIHPDVMGSDHCPVSVTLHSLRPVSQRCVPSFATKHYPEFKGKQVSIKDLLLSSRQSVPTETISLIKCSEENNQKNVKKRALEVDPVSKAQTTKQVQTNLRNFFVKRRKEEDSSYIPEFQKDASIANQFENCKDEEPSPHEPERKRLNSSDAWKKLMKAPDVPLCQGHKEPCVRRTVKKKGANFGREFWSCSHGVGKSGDPNANCNYFQWVKATSAK